MKKLKIVILTLLIFMFVSLSILLYKINHSPVVLDNVILNREVNNKTIAMYVGRDSNYEEYDGNKFPSGYNLNLDRSKCIDNNGTEIKDALKEESGNISLTTNKSSYCYLYFDEKENLGTICNGSTMQECISDNKDKITTIENLSNNILGNMYRYQGQAVNVDNNYICFGTSDKEKCVQDPDLYMYRIIGIEESGRVKLIKKEALNKTVNWWTDFDSDKKFPDSKIYEAINGADFLKNSDYIPEGWEEKIATNTWMYGDILEYGPDSLKQPGKQLYLTEIGKKTTTWYNYATKDTPSAQSQVADYDSSPYKGQTIYYTIGNDYWTESFGGKEGKVSLMYISDYSYSVGNDDDEINADVWKTGWMHLSQNDTNAPSSNEWTMMRYGWSRTSGFFSGFVIFDTGYPGAVRLNGSVSIRPVFYLNNTIGLTGLGTIDNPYLIKAE